MSKRNEPIEILIVEDEPEWLKGLEAIYRQIFRDNVNVTVALNRQTALEALKRVEERRRPLDVLSLDINLRHGESGVGKPPPSGLPVLRKAGQRTLARVAILVTAIARDYELRVAIPDDNERRQLRIGLGAYAKTLFGRDRVFYVPKSVESPAFEHARRDILHTLELEGLRSRVLRIIKESPVEVSYALDFRGGKGDQVPPPLTIRTSLNPRAIVVEDLRLRRMMYFLADLGTQSLPLSEDEFLRLCDVEPLPQDAFKKKYGKAKKTTLYRLFQTNVQRPLGRLRITTSSLVKKRPDGYTLTNVRLVHGLSSGPHGEIQYFDETQQYGACPARS